MGARRRGGDRPRGIGLLLLLPVLALAACGAPDSRRVTEAEAQLLGLPGDRPATLDDLAAPIATVPRDAPRTALVIGIGDYRALPDLDNPAKDARLIADTLRRMGFEISGGGPLLDPSRARMLRAVAAYRAEIAARGGIGLIYYAGHAVQIDGRNLLAPADAAPESLATAETELIGLPEILGTERQAAMNLVILDACRDNPFQAAPAPARPGVLPDRAPAEGLRAVSPGLSRVIAPPNTLVAFATAPGDVALDGAGGNSPYALALAAALTEPGMRVEDVFIKVRQIVESTTAGRQTPWETSSLTNVAYLNPIDGTQPARLTTRFDGRWVGQKTCERVVGDPPDVDLTRPVARHLDIRNGQALFIRGGTSPADAVEKRRNFTRIAFRVAEDGTVSADGEAECCWHAGTRLDDRTNAITLDGAVDAEGTMALAGTEGPRQCTWRLRRR